MYLHISCYPPFSCRRNTIPATLTSGSPLFLLISLIWNIEWIICNIFDLLGQDEGEFNLGLRLFIYGHIFAALNWITTVRGGDEYLYAVKFT